MKTSARFLAVLVAVLMLATAALTVSASFSDVEDGYDHAPAIATLSQLGVINGYADGTFKPNNNVERDEMAKLIYVLYTTFSDAGEGSVKFADVAADNWATGYISWCSAKSIVGGYEDGSFRPDNNITYDEALKMACAALGYTDFKIWPTDVRLKALKDLDLGAGLEDVKGSDKLTRGQVAQLLYNALFEKMNETKIEYVKDMSLQAPDGTMGVDVAREVPKVLATDVWAFTEEIVRVIGTENYALAGVTSAAKTDADDAILLAKFDGTNWVADAAATELADLGLEAYEENTDALIGLDIMTVEKDGEALAKASVLGSVKVAEVVSVDDNDGDPETDMVKIDGVLYDNTKKNDNKFSGLKKLVYSAGTMTVADAFTIDVTSGVADLEYPHTALVIDQNGDGIVDGIAVDYAKLAVVTKVDDYKATTVKEAYSKYTFTAELDKEFDGDPATTPSTSTVLSTAIADAKDLAKGDVFVYSVINGVYYIDEVIAPVTAGVSKITAGDTAAITLDEIGAVRYIDGASFFKDGGYNITAMLDATELFKEDAKDQDYYIYNDVVVFATGFVAPVESYNIALLTYTEAPTEPVIVNNKYIINYPANLIINGESVKVNINSIDGVAAETAWETYKMTSVGGYAQLKYTLVTYTVEEDGTYTIKTTGQTDLGDTVVVAADKQITINTNTGLYSIDGKKFELTDDSVIYALFDDDNTDLDATKKLNTYTKANILKKFNPVTTKQATYLLKIDDNTYTLLATVIEEKMVAPDEIAERTFKNDARLIKYAPYGSNIVSKDGKAYYEYSFMNWADLSNGAHVIDTTNVIADATATVAGTFYGWDDSAKKYVPVTTGTTGLTSVDAAALTGVDVARGIVYLKDVDGTDAVNFTDGIKLGSDVKILAASAKDNNSSYVADFNIEALAALFERYNEYTAVNNDENPDNDTYINVAIGTYTDEDGALQIAWLIVDNYYIVTADGAETLTAATALATKIAPVLS